LPELPELTVLARQARAELTGKTICAVWTVQPKCLNLPPAEMQSLLVGRSIITVYERGKWLFIDLAGGGEVAVVAAANYGSAPVAHLLLNLGMGGDFYYTPAPGPTGLPSDSPGSLLAEKHQLKLAFRDGADLAVRFWWFGHVHAVPAGELGRHAMTATLGPSPLDPRLSFPLFRDLVTARPRRSVKSFLIDQKVLAGIGNVYVQDSLWGARLHPDRLLGTLSVQEITALWNSIRDVLSRSIAKGGLAFERDFYGRPGGYGRDDHDVAYKPGEFCPRCAATIQKIRTGSTSTFICPICQTR
jgi:formamidopyrimidine-DNA glycosylase